MNEHGYAQALMIVCLDRAQFERRRLGDWLVSLASLILSFKYDDDADEGDIYNPARYRANKYNININSEY